MINPTTHNTVYLSSLLEKEHPEVFMKMKRAAERFGNFGVVEGTKDIWARDYMPVQVSQDKFISFLYEPDYLRKDDYGRERMTDAHALATKLPIQTKQVNINLDGGNIVSNGKLAIMCNKVFRENQTWKESRLSLYLSELLEVNGIIFIPKMEEDEIGHADGIVRFVNDDTVLMMDYSFIDKEYHQSVLQVLKKHKLNVEILPYQEPKNISSELDARGFWINYLELEHCLLVPEFYGMDNNNAYHKLQSLFPNKELNPIPASTLARKGGVLNCVAWSYLT